MAKSIYDVLDDLKTDTSVPNYGQVDHTLPRELLPTAEQFESGPDLLAWAEENGFTHSCLQKGVQKFLIDLRATFKAVKKNEEWTPEKGQIAVDSAEWNVTKRPKGKKSDADIATDYLSKLSEEERKILLATFEVK